MRRIGLTGGIGAGKSTAARAFAHEGATVLDADAVAREVVGPGTPGLRAIAAAFPEVVSGGALDREALGRVVFADDAARRRLEAITHPLVGAEVARRAEVMPAGGVLVYDVPLLVETGMANSFDLVVVIEAPLAVRLARLADRGLPPEQARERIAKQASDEQRRAAADIVFDNAGDLEVLAEQVAVLWSGRLEPFAAYAAARTPAPRGPVDIVAADPAWPSQAARLTARLRRVTGHEVEHIGSTAVPGLPAQDVLDLQLTVSDLAEADRLAAAIAEAGFPRLPASTAHSPHDRGAWSTRFHRNADPGRAVNLHLCPVGSPGALGAVAFRDWLRAVPAERENYLAAKRLLAAGQPDADAYAAAKEGWFAAAWPRLTAWSTGR